METGGGDSSSFEAHGPEPVTPEGWRVGLVVLGLMVLIGSSTAAAAKLAVTDLPVALLPVIRFGGAGLALLPFVGGWRAIQGMLRADGKTLLMAAALAVPVNQGFFLNGAKLAPTTHVGLIYATCPLVVLGLALLFRQERWAGSRVAGIVACVAGAAVIAVGTFSQRGRGAATVLQGDLLLVGAVISWGAYLTVNKRLIGRHPSLAVLAATFLLGALLCLPIALWWSPGWGPVFAKARPAAWWSLAYLTLFASLFGLAFQNIALRRFDASHVAAVGNLSPVLTVLWGVWLLQESLHPSLLFGGALTLLGIVLASRPVAVAAVPVGMPTPETPTR